MFQNETDFYHMIDFIKLIRTKNIIIALLSMYLVLWLAGLDQINLFFLLGNIAVILITAGSNIINDIYDLEIDKINRPDRPLVQGKISIKTAKILTFSFFLVAVFIGFVLPLEAMKIEWLAIFLLLLYTSVFKPLPFLGNATVALVTALLFIFSAELLGAEGEGNVPALLAFGIHMIRELVKDMEDEKGDRKIGLTTLAITWPRKKLNRLVQFITTLFILYLISLIYFNYYGLVFSIIMAVSVIPYCIYLIISMAKPALEKKEYHQHSSYLKMAMFIGLISMGLGKWFITI